MSATAAVRLEAVTKSFVGTPVLRGVDLAVEPGEVVAIVGPSGCGKSTLLRLVNGLEIRDGGALRVLGVDVPLGGIAAHPTDRFWLPLRRRIGFVFQSFHLYPHRTALDNVAMAPERVARRERAAAREAAMALLERVGLADRAHAHPRHLSGGQQQRVAIARALAMDPDVLLLDEPTSALDPARTAEVLRVVGDLAAEHARALMIVTHEYGFARDVADRAAFLDEGRVVEVGPARVVLGEPTHERTRAFLRGAGPGPTGPG
jgi:ABC-type polar amino acid transport system ATPase subunit